jgi:hypothetical protein
MGALESQHSLLSWAAANPETGPSVLWFAAIQGIKGKQDLAGLAPKDCFIPA